MSLSVDQSDWAPSHAIFVLQPWRTKARTAEKGLPVRTSSHSVDSRTSSKSFHFSCPCDSFQSGRDATTVNMHVPEFFAIPLDAFRVDVHDNTLTAKLQRRHG